MSWRFGICMGTRREGCRYASRRRAGEGVVAVDRWIGVRGVLFWDEGKRYWGFDEARVWEGDRTGVHSADSMAHVAACNV